MNTMNKMSVTVVQPKRYRIWERWLVILLIGLLWPLLTIATGAHASTTNLTTPRPGIIGYTIDDDDDDDDDDRGRDDDDDDDEDDDEDRALVRKGMVDRVPGNNKHGLWRIDNKYYAVTSKSNIIVAPGASLDDFVVGQCIKIQLTPGTISIVRTIEIMPSAYCATR